MIPFHSMTLFQINIAIDSRETLISQRHAFKAIQAKLNDLSSRS